MGLLFLRAFKRDAEPSETNQAQQNMNVPNPETANPKDVIRFISIQERDIVKQVYNQLKGLGVNIPANLDSLFQEKIKKGYFFLEDGYWRTSIENYQKGKEQLDSFAETYSFELKGVHINAYKNHLKNCIIYEQVMLKKEPHNQYDKNAIKVVVGSKMIGRVPIEETLMVHNILEKDYKAFIESISNNDDFLDVSIIVYYKS